MRAERATPVAMTTTTAMVAGSILVDFIRASAWVRGPNPASAAAACTSRSNYTMNETRAPHRMHEDPAPSCHGYAGDGQAEALYHGNRGVQLCDGPLQAYCDRVPWSCCGQSLDAADASRV